MAAAAAEEASAASMHTHDNIMYLLYIICIVYLYYNIGLAMCVRVYYCARRVLVLVSSSTCPKFLSTLPL